MIKNVKSFIEDVFMEKSHMYNIDKIMEKLSNTDKCTSKWCQTCVTKNDKEKS